MAQRKNIMVNGVLTPVWQTDATAQEIDDAAKKTAWQCNPNLLDNWYFGNPVNQRNGYIQIGGTMMYTDTACTQQFGPSSGTTPVNVYGSYARPIDGGVELGLYIPIESCVKGYSGVGYTIDRFWSAQANATVKPTDEGILFSGLDWGQRIENKRILLNVPFTYSLLTADNELGAITFQFNGTTNQTVYETLGDTGIQANFIYNWTDAGNSPFFLQSQTSEKTILAVKLELGDTQTLAHQDANGNWVLNEIPDYGEQLRRCQRYFVRISNVYASGHVAAANTAFVDLITPVPMRANPTVTVNGYGGISANGEVQVPSQITLALLVQNHVYLNCALSTAWNAGNAVCLHDAYIDLSADL